MLGFPKMQTVSYQLRVRIGLMLLLILGFISSQHPVQFFSYISRNLSQPDEISLFITQVACLREALPAHGVIGYFINEVGTVSFSDLEESKRYFLTQYTLAPLVVEPGLSHNWIVGNLKDGMDAVLIAKDLGLEVIEECGGGTFLFRKPEVIENR